MKNHLLAVTSAAILACAPLSIATSATALTESECGGVPDGGLLVIIPDGARCEVSWDTPGTYEWSPPANVDQIWAIVVGGGGGGGGRPDQNEAFGGDGASMNYIQLDRNVDAFNFIFTVGAGGASSTTQEPGEDGEWTTIASTTLNFGTQGGDGNGPNTANYGTCGAEISGYTFGEGSRVDFVGTSDGTCIGGVAGIIPADDILATDLFDDDDSEYSRGGGVYINTTPLDPGPGHGARVVYTEGEGATVDPFGSDGLVMFRYTLLADEQLASTGFDFAPAALFAGGLTLAGFAITTRARRTR